MPGLCPASPLTSLHPDGLGAVDEFHLPISLLTAGEGPVVLRGIRRGLQPLRQQREVPAEGVNDLLHTLLVKLRQPAGQLARAVMELFHARCQRGHILPQGLRALIELDRAFRQSVRAALQAVKARVQLSRPGGGLIHSGGVLPQSLAEGVIAVQRGFQPGSLPGSGTVSQGGDDAVQYLRVVPSAPAP